MSANKPDRPSHSSPDSGTAPSTGNSPSGTPQTPLDDSALFSQLLALAEQAHRLDLANELRRRGNLGSDVPCVIHVPSEVSDPPQAPMSGADNPPASAVPPGPANVEDAHVMLGFGIDEPGKSVTHTLSGLPPGLSINPGTGVISGIIGRPPAEGES